MKKLIFLLLTIGLLITACQKSLPDIDIPVNNPQERIIMGGDTLTYEVLTADPGGWFGVWNRSDGVLTSNGIITGLGVPDYFSGGWKYTFIAPSRPFQALISVFARSFAYDITANLYKNGELIKSVTNEGMKGFAKLMVDVQTDSLVGTPSDPVLTYQVLVTEPDLTKFQPDAWNGQWNTPAAVVNDLSDPLLSSLFPMPGGWKYSFKPDHLPFRMYLGAGPHSPNGGKITINFFVNGQLVKTVSARQWIYGTEYIVR